MALNNNAININAGFEIGSSQPIDSRQLLTKAQMLSIDDNIMPSKYFCICKDDGLLYTYDANNEVDEELGKFRVASGLEVIRLTQAKYNQMVEDGKIEDKFYLITDAPNPSIGGASNALEIAYDNTNSGLAAVNVQDAIDEVNEKTDAKLDKVTTMPATPSDGDTVLFIGTSTNDYKKGHTYQYQTNEWVLISQADVDLSHYKKIFNGTMEEWDALTPAEQAEYDFIATPDEAVEDIADAVIDGDTRAVTSNAVAQTIDGLSNNLYTLISSTALTTTATDYTLILDRKLSDYDYIIVQQYDSTSLRNAVVIHLNQFKNKRVILTTLHGANTSSASDYSVSGINVQYIDDTTINAYATGSALINVLEIVGVKITR